MAQKKRIRTDEWAVADTDFALGAAIIAALLLAGTALFDIPLDGLLDGLLSLIQDLIP